MGYFSYDIIRYIEKVPDKCIDDLKIPDIRIMRPKTLIIYDNLHKKIFFIVNCFADEKISDYEGYYLQLINKINYLKNCVFDFELAKKSKKNKSKIKIKSNITKKKFKQIVNKAKKYIQKGDIFQVVLSQRFETRLSKPPIDIYKKLL